ncbi:hypothetical protein [Plantactinospora sp. CA-290183]|uniref:hypothetical protein n=1 Tax=Plantactinospora sp. CA-290183 TaxID=3240006 RepID=UPI003D92007B
MTRRTARLAVPMLLLSALTGCVGSAGEPHTLVLSATGTAALENVTYTVGGETVEEKTATLPWEKTFQIRSGKWDLVIRHRAGDVQAIATVDGKLLTQGAGGGTGTGQVQLSGSIDD